MLAVLLATMPVPITFPLLSVKVTVPSLIARFDGVVRVAVIVVSVFVCAVSGMMLILVIAF